jgi:hypothetical protein
MTQISRRSVLITGLALPGIVEAVYHGGLSEDDGKPKRFEELVGFQTQASKLHASVASTV